MTPMGDHSVPTSGVATSMPRQPVLEPSILLAHAASGHPMMAPSTSKPRTATTMFRHHVALPVTLLKLRRAPMVPLANSLCNSELATK